jgi:hypothetical protein
LCFRRKRERCFDGRLRKRLARCEEGDGGGLARPYRVLARAEAGARGRRMDLRLVVLGRRAARIHVYGRIARNRSQATQTIGPTRLLRQRSNGPCDMLKARHRGGRIGRSDVLGQDRGLESGSARSRPLVGIPAYYRGNQFIVLVVNGFRAKMPGLSN